MNYSLDYKEIEIVIEKITQKIREEIIIANRVGILKETLKKYNYEEQQNQWYSNVRISKMIIIGDVKEKDVMKCATEMGIDKNRIEIYSDYNKLSNTDFCFLKENFNYSDILVCAMPHKMKNIDGYSSFINMIEKNQNNYPPMIKITDQNGNLKFSKTGFKNALLKSNLFKEENGELL